MAGEFDEDPERTGGGGGEVREPAEGTGVEPTGETGDRADLSGEPVGPETEQVSDAPAPVGGRQVDAVPSAPEPIGPGAEDHSDLPADDATDQTPEAGDRIPDQHPTDDVSQAEVPEGEPVDETVEEAVEDPEPQPEATGESVEPVWESDEPAEPVRDVDEPEDQSAEPVDLSEDPVEAVDGSVESVQPVDEWAEPVDASAEPVEPVDEPLWPVDTSDELTAPVREEPDPEWFPGEGLPTPERLPSAEFQAFLDERHAGWKANLADPRHLTGLPADGSEVPDPVTRPEDPGRVSDAVTQSSARSLGDGAAALPSEGEPVGADRHPESGDEPVGADRHPESDDEPGEDDHQQHDRLHEITGLVDAAAHEASPASIVQLLGLAGVHLDDTVVKQLYEMAPAAGHEFRYHVRRLLERLR